MGSPNAYFVMRQGTVSIIKILRRWFFGIRAAYLSWQGNSVDDNAGLLSSDTMTNRPVLEALIPVNAF